MPQEQTSLFDLRKIDTENIRTTLNEVYKSLELKKLYIFIL